MFESPQNMTASISDVMNKAGGMYGKRSNTSWANLFLPLTGKERTNMAEPWRAQMQKKTSFFKILIEQPQEAHRWKYVQICYVFWSTCVFISIQFNLHCVVLSDL